MTTTVTTKRQHLLETLALAKASHPLLSVYLDTDALRTIPEHVRLRAKNLFQNTRGDLDRSEDFRKGFERAREAVEAVLSEVGTGERGLALFADTDGRVLDQTYLPGQIVQDSVRYGPGADVLPVIDALDELEPVAVCRVERAKATVLVIEAGEIVYRKHITSEVPQKSRATTREDWWSASKFQHHQEEHVRRHLRHVAELLEETLRRHPTRRLFLTGSTEAIANFRRGLKGPLSDLVRGTFPSPNYVSDAIVRDTAVKTLVEAERRAEEALVEELIVRGNKDARAVLGAYATAYAVQGGEAHQLVIAAEAGPIQGRRCPACGHVGPDSETQCPVCQTQTLRADLARELAILAVRRDVPVEIVHGKAATDLASHGGLGAFLKFLSAT